MPRFVLFTYPDASPERPWDEWSASERDAFIERHDEWFRRYAQQIRGGENLAWPKVIKTVRRHAGQPMVTDGPFVESKEFIGGLIVVEADTIDEAVAMAAEWPSLESPGAAVQVEAVAQRRE